jgi:hypothetical protein
MIKKKKQGNKIVWKKYGKTLKVMRANTKSVI